MASGIEKCLGIFFMSHAILTYCRNFTTDVAGLSCRIWFADISPQLHVCESVCECVCVCLCLSVSVCLCVWLSFYHDRIWIPLVQSAAWGFCVLCLSRFPCTLDIPSCFHFKGLSFKVWGPRWRKKNLPILLPYQSATSPGHLHPISFWLKDTEQILST